MTSWRIAPGTAVAMLGVALAIAALPAAANHYILCTAEGKCQPLAPPASNETSQGASLFHGSLFPGFVFAGWQDWQDRQGRRLVAGGSTYSDRATETRALAVVRELPKGGGLDRSFNGTGYVELPVWGTDGEMALAVAVQHDGKILVGGNTMLPCKEYESWACDAVYMVVMRVMDDGSVDTTFGHAGRTILRVGIGYSYTSLTGLTPQPDGSVILLDPERVPIARLDATGALDTTFDGCALSQPEQRCAATAFDLEVAVEFYNAERDHYFVTTRPDELAALDKELLRGWARTDRSFPVYPAQPSREIVDAKPVCRLYGSPAAGLDTHFYSVNADECAELAARADGAWIEETAHIFRLALPDVSGACTEDRQPVYRLWNGRADVNHRYVTSRRERDAMVSNGFIAEGNGPDKVAFCAPRLCAPDDALCRKAVSD